MPFLCRCAVRGVLSVAQASASIFVGKLDEALIALFKCLDEPDLAEPVRQSLAHTTGHFLALCATLPPPAAPIAKKEKRPKLNLLPCGFDNVIAYVRAAFLKPAGEKGAHTDMRECRVQAKPKLALLAVFAYSSAIPVFPVCDRGVATVRTLALRCSGARLFLNAALST